LPALLRKLPVPPGSPAISFRIVAICNNWIAHFLGTSVAFQKHLCCRCEESDAELGNTPLSTAAPLEGK
jgi:hypothetical protein